MLILYKIRTNNERRKVSKRSKITFYIEENEFYYYFLVFLIYFYNQGFSMLS